MVRLLAPKNNWSMTSGDSWWPFRGSAPTVAGKMISEETASKFVAVNAATRVISETLASLPCNLMERMPDGRTNRVASELPLQRLVHDEPNPEQDSMCFTDMQTAFSVNWGNDFAEIRRTTSGEVAELWPIHPSRIPVSNITRNPATPPAWPPLAAGSKPGEIVYWVKNDDGTVSPIPASDMLHVPGASCTNGITGQSLIRMMANAIGIGMATEEHAGALFKNGAVTNMVIKSPKTVGPETAQRLREQWQSRFASGANAYKTMILEEGMDAIPISMNPDDTQLILARQFSVTEIARGWRLPPHLLADLTRSTNSNIEQQSLEFIIYSMMPWIIRREKAMNRQLLTAEQKLTYYFKFNVLGLLRGDSAARAAFYTALFQMGVYSPNDIRECEDLNPVDGGDQRFIPGNNLIPLDKASELAQAQIDKMKAPPPNPQQSNPPVQPAQDKVRLRNLRAMQESIIAAVEKKDASLPTMLAQHQAATMTGLETFADKIATKLDVTFEEAQAALEAQRKAADESREQQDAANREALAQFGEKLDTLPGAIAESVSSATAPIAAAAQSAVENASILASEAEKRAETVISDAKTAFYEQSAAVVASVAAIPAAIGQSLAPLGEKLDAIPASLTTAVQPLTQAVEASGVSLVESLESKLTPVVASVAAIPEQVQAAAEKAVQDLAKQAAEARDTTETDEIASKKALLDQKQAEIDAKLAAEREITDRVLTLSLKRAIDNLVSREAGAIISAREQPRAFPGWRLKFYREWQQRFRHELEEYVESSATCGITLDLEWAAERYAKQSIDDLKTVDSDANDNNYDAVKAKTDEFVKQLWSERSQALAVEMIERGRRVFGGRENA